MKITSYRKNLGGRRFYMNKVAQRKEKDYIVDIIENTSSNDWEDLCKKCSSIISDASMTEKDIDRIVNKCKKG